MEGLLNDEHALRCLSGAVEAAQLRTIFAAVVTADAGDVSSVELTLRSLIAAIKMQADRNDIILNAGALSSAADGIWSWQIPLPARQPFREVKLWIDADATGEIGNVSLLELLADALEVQRLAKHRQSSASTNLQSARGGAEHS